VEENKNNKFFTPVIIGNKKRNERRKIKKKLKTPLELKKYKF